MTYDKPIWTPLRKGSGFQRYWYYEENCPEKAKHFCGVHTSGTDTNKYDVLVYAIKGDKAILKHPAGRYWSGIGSTSYSSGWIVVLDLKEGKRGGEKEIWDCAKDANGRPKKADIQALIDKYLT